jgi:chromate transporter
VTDKPSIPETAFIELFALGTALPGPLSPKLAASFGATFGGLLGAIVCFIVFAAPGAVAMACAGVWFHSDLQAPGADLSVQFFADHSIGLVSAAFGLVVIAAFKIYEKACARSSVTALICIGTVVIGVLVPPSAASYFYVSCMALGGAAILVQSKQTECDDDPAPDLASDWNSGIHTTTGLIALAMFVGLTLVMVMWRPSTLLGKLFRTFWRVGCTVFGGGQVVLPFLLNEVVESEWLPANVFMSGFGLVGCMPGPFSNIAPFVGGAMLSWKGALCAFIGLFSPSLFLIVGVLPFWDCLRKSNDVRVFMQGVNAAAAGLIVAGVWMLMRRVMVSPLAFSISISAAAASVLFNVPAPYILVGSGLAGAVFVSLGVGSPYH